MSSAVLIAQQLQRFVKERKGKKKKEKEIASAALATVLLTTVRFHWSQGAPVEHNFLPSLLFIAGQHPSVQVTTNNCNANQSREVFDWSYLESNKKKKKLRN